MGADANAGGASETTPAHASIEDRARAWLAKQGYPLEFRVANELHKRDFVVWPSHYPPAPMGQPAREIDVLAAMLLEHGEGKYLGIEVFVECKHTEDRPWIFFVSEHARGSSQTLAAEAQGDDAGHALLWLIADQEPIKQNAFFRMPDRPAYGGVPIHHSGEGPDRVYSTLQGISEAMRREGALRRLRGPATARDFLEAAIRFPLVVCSGPLCEARFDPNADDVIVGRVRRTRVLWRANSAGSPLCIDVVSVEELPTLLDEWRSASWDLLEQLEEVRQMVLRAFAAQSLVSLLPLISDRYDGRPVSLPRALQSLVT